MKIKNAYEKENKKLQPIEIIKWTDKQREHEREHSHNENNRQILREQADCIPIEKPTRGHFVINQMTSMRENVNQNDQAN